MKKQNRNTWLFIGFLLLAGILALLAMTNDILSLVYIPRIGLSEFILNTGT